MSHYASGRSAQSVGHVSHYASGRSAQSSVMELVITYARRQKKMENEEVRHVVEVGAEAKGTI